MFDGYNMAQFYIRRSLKDNNDTVPNQLKKPINNPTARWIFRMMLGISVVQVKLKDAVINEFVTNLSNVTTKIIRHFGARAMKIYGVPSGNIAYAVT